MLQYYFALQFRMINRMFADAGIKPLLAYILLIPLYWGLSVFLFSKTEFARYLYILFALVLIAKLSHFKRTEFMEQCFGKAVLLKIRIAENLVCSLPFIIFLLYRQLYVPAVLLPVLASIFVFLNLRTQFNYTIWTPFSKASFEFIAGFRNSFYFILAAYILSAIAVGVGNFNLGVFALLLVFLTTLSYYAKPENEYYVWIYKLSPRQFLVRKMWVAITFSSVLALPIALLLFVFFPHHYGILLLAVLLGWAFLVSMIVGKYAAYPDELSITQGIFLAFCLWFPPLLIVLIPYLFRKSENRLSTLLK
jgi:hypothetical protein